MTKIIPARDPKQCDRAATELKKTGQGKQQAVPRTFLGSAKAVWGVAPQGDSAAAGQHVGTGPAAASALEKHRITQCACRSPKGKVEMTYNHQWLQDTRSDSTSWACEDLCRRSSL